MGHANVKHQIPHCRRCVSLAHYLYFPFARSVQEQFEQSKIARMSNEHVFLFASFAAANSPQFSTLTFHCQGEK